MESPKLITDLAQGPLRAILRRVQRSISSGSRDSGAPHFFGSAAGSAARRFCPEGKLDTVQSSFTNQSPRSCDCITFCVKKVLNVSERPDIALRIVTMTRARLAGTNA